MAIKKAKHKLTEAPVDAEGKRVPAANVVTILRSGRDEPATKVYGHVLNSDDAKDGLVGTRQFGNIRYWEVHEESFLDSEGLFSIIEKWSKDNKAAVIHGGFVGVEQIKDLIIKPNPYRGKDGAMVQPAPFPAVDERGLVVRQLVAMRDRPTIYMMLDVDGWKVRDPDAQGEPMLMAEDYIRHNLPAGFQNASYTLQLSSSSFLIDCLGKTKKDKSTGQYEEPGLFKGHFFFVLDRPMYVGVMNEWVKLLKVNGMFVDPRTVHPVQVCYIAPPIFSYADDGNDAIDGEFDRIDTRTQGIQDPHPEGRLHYVKKEMDAVDCSGIDVVSLAAKADAGSRRAVVKSGRETAKLFDSAAADLGISVDDAAFSRAVSRMIIGAAPRRQVGIETERGYWIGAVNRAYPIWDLLETHLADRYLHVGRGRLTFLLSASGSAESAYVCDDQQRIGSTSDSDLVSRSGGPCNAFDLMRLHFFGDLDTDLTQKIQERPSYKSMLDWARKDKKTISEYRKMQMTKKIEDQKKGLATEEIEVAEEIAVSNETRLVANGTGYSSTGWTDSDLRHGDLDDEDSLVDEDGGEFEDSIDPELAGETRFENSDPSNTGAKIYHFGTGQQLDPNTLIGEPQETTGTTNVPAPAPAKEEWYPEHSIRRVKPFSQPWHNWLEKVQDKDGNVMVAPKSIINTVVIVQNDEITKNIFYNNLSKSVEVDGPVPWREPGKFQDPGVSAGDITGIRCALQRKWGFPFSKENVEDAIITLENSKRFRDPLYDYLTSLRGKWDGVPRLDSMLIDFMGADDNKVVRLITRRWAIGAVARGIRGAAMVKGSEEGIKVDNSLILVGKQNLGKSSFINELVPNPEWRAARPPSFSGNNRDTTLWMQGKWMIEDTELDAIGTDEKPQTGAKGFLTDKIDYIVPKFQNQVRRYHRRSIIVGTIDRRHFLQSEGPNRRFWPVIVRNSITKGALASVADQIWAEAIVALDAGERWWIGDSTAREAAIQNALARYTRGFAQTSPLQGSVEGYVQDKEIVCVPEIMDSIYPRSKSAVSVDENRRRADEIRKCLKALGWTEGDRRRFGKTMGYSTDYGVQTPFHAPAEGYYGDDLDWDSLDDSAVTGQVDEEDKGW